MTTEAPLTPARVPLTDHPCFDEAARARTARVHLPRSLVDIEDK